jgi:hypothetical protein
MHKLDDLGRLHKAGPRLIAPMELDYVGFGGSVEEFKKGKQIQ